MAFDNLLNNTNNEDLQKKQLVAQALRRQEYNRRYQARLRSITKLLTLEKRIDANLIYVIGYIKKKYSAEYDNYVEPEEAPVVTNPAFNNWVLLSGAEYKSIKEAFELSGLGQYMTLEDFSVLFNQNYKENNRGRYTKH